jgi:tripartite-type tricarboxylate transporter receptor subunit TctC
MTILRICGALLALSLVVPMTAPTAARADEWPSRTIRLIVPFPPGGSTDVGARLIGTFT